MNGKKSLCRVCEKITDANKDIFWTFARTHQPEDKEEFHRVPARFCPACGREIGAGKSGGTMYDGRLDELMTEEEYMQSIKKGEHNAKEDQGTVWDPHTSDGSV